MKKSYGALPSRVLLVTLIIGVAGLCVFFSNRDLNFRSSFGGTEFVFIDDKYKTKFWRDLVI